MQRNVRQTDLNSACLQSSLDSRQHHSDNWVKAKFNWINPFFLTQPLLISENKNILMLLSLRKYFAWYFQKIFCQLITKNIFPDIVHNCSYSWRNRILVLVKKNFWICVEKSFWISSTESQEEEKSSIFFHFLI